MGTATRLCQSIADGQKEKQKCKKLQSFTESVTGQRVLDSPMNLSLLTWADGRAIGMPLYFFPWLQAASDAQRHDYQLYHVSVNWEDLGEGIDMIAMLTGLYIKDKPKPERAPAAQEAAAT